MIFRGYFVINKDDKVNFAISKFTERILTPKIVTIEKIVKVEEPNPNYDSKKPESDLNKKSYSVDKQFLEVKEELFKVDGSIHYSFDKSEEKEIQKKLKADKIDYIFEEINLPEWITPFNQIPLNGTRIEDFLPPNILPQEINSTKNILLNYVNKRCSKIINDGIDLNTSVGKMHFSVTDIDKTNMLSLRAELSLALLGVPSKVNPSLGIPYHADGQLCRLWTPEEFIYLTDKCTEYVLYQTTYCNHLRDLIKRSTLEECQYIFYGMPLPADLQSNFNMVLGIE